MTMHYKAHTNFYNRHVSLVWIFSLWDSNEFPIFWYWQLTCFINILGFCSSFRLCGWLALPSRSSHRQVSGLQDSWIPGNYNNLLWSCLRYLLQQIWTRSCWRIHFWYRQWNRQWSTHWHGLQCSFRWWEEGRSQQCQVSGDNWQLHQLQPDTSNVFWWLSAGLFEENPARWKPHGLCGSVFNGHWVSAPLQHSYLEDQEHKVI